MGKRTTGRYEIPILVINFNRPDLSKRVLEAVCRVNPNRLYVAFDGPRVGKPDDLDLINQGKNAVSKLEGRFQIHRLYQDSNLGCRRAVPAAIDWFFKNEEAGVILEDDCVPSDEFFYFCEFALNKYRSEKRVGCINGFHVLGNLKQVNASYYYTHFPNIWGWASWRRAWEGFDLQMSGWPRDAVGDRLLKKVFSNQFDYLRQEWRKMFWGVYRGGGGTWDVQFVYHLWKSDMISVQPYVNLVENIGFDERATHTKVRDRRRKFTECGKIGDPIIPPKTIEPQFLQEQFSVHGPVNSFIRIAKRIKQTKSIKVVYQQLLRLRGLPDSKKVKFLNIGCGGNVIRDSGWLNLDIEPSRNVYFFDAKKRIPLPDACCEGIFSEHMIEHIERHEAEHFLRECWRVLLPGGKIRIVTPNLHILPDVLEQRAAARCYLEFAKEAFSCETADDAINMLFYGHGHKYLYSFQSLSKSMEKAGFKNFRPCEVGDSSSVYFLDRERHGETVGHEENKFESLVVEAEK